MHKYTEEEIKRMNKTSRFNGCIGATAVVPRLINGLCHKNSYILDYGCGKGAPHSKYLREAGFAHVRSADIGENATGNIVNTTTIAAVDLLDSFNVVFASNVINVQESESGIREVARDARDFLRAGGTFICNYPSSPRRLKLTLFEVAQIISDVFGAEVDIMRSGASAIYMVRKGHKV